MEIQDNLAWKLIKSNTISGITHFPELISIVGLVTSKTCNEKQSDVIYKQLSIISGFSTLMTKMVEI